VYLLNIQQFSKYHIFPQKYDIGTGVGLTARKNWREWPGVSINNATGGFFFQRNIIDNCFVIVCQEYGTIICTQIPWPQQKENEASLCTHNKQYQTTASDYSHRSV